MRTSRKKSYKKKKLKSQKRNKRKNLKSKKYRQSGIKIKKTPKKKITHGTTFVQIQKNKFHKCQNDNCSICLTELRVINKHSIQNKNLDKLLNASPKDKLQNRQSKISVMNFINKLPIRKLQCGHCFHEQCINVWLESKNTCPICRSVVRKETYSDYLDDLLDGDNHSQGDEYLQQYQSPISRSNSRSNSRSRSISPRTIARERFREYVNSGMTIDEIPDDVVEGFYRQY
tara:strand:- start:110 stop:799 length:690 start_codon:yes stop_codon:yes gene_type:complete